MVVAAMVRHYNPVETAAPGASAAWVAGNQSVGSASAISHSTSLPCVRVAAQVGSAALCT